jgi:histidinol-phosphate aminotransferase
MNLHHHGDAELAPGLVDLAVNVRHAPMPSWLSESLKRSLRDLRAYPDQTRARTAVAAHHARTPEEVLLTAGAAEAFVLLARALAPRWAVVVHPQFTEPEAALRAAGHPVEQLILAPDFELAGVPEAADLVFVGNPTNPTSVAHPNLERLARPGRVLVVDEAFADTATGVESLAHRGEVPGLVVIRSLTKTWGLAGLRVGYLLADAALVRDLSAVQPLWPVSAPGLAAIEACRSPAGAAEERRIAADLVQDRATLVEGLRAIPGVRVCGAPVASFVLIEVADGLAVRAALRHEGFAVRRGDTFPGLGPDWLRIAVRDAATTRAFLNAFAEVMSRSTGAAQ